MENTFLRLPQQVIAGFATWMNDPAGEVPMHAQTLPFAAEFQGAMDPWVDAGAVGFVGILRGLPWETNRYYVPYNDGKVRPIPGMWVSSGDGDRLLEFLDGRRGRARLMRAGILLWITPGTDHFLDKPYPTSRFGSSRFGRGCSSVQLWMRTPDGCSRPRSRLASSRCRKPGNSRQCSRTSALSSAGIAMYSTRAWRTRWHVIGDTVGDPFKDTAGPSLHVLVTLVAAVALVLAPLFV